MFLKPLNSRAIFLRASAKSSFVMGLYDITAIVFPVERAPPVVVHVENHEQAALFGRLGEIFYGLQIPFVGRAHQFVLAAFPLERQALEL